MFPGLVALGRAPSREDEFPFVFWETWSLSNPEGKEVRLEFI